MSHSCPRCSEPLPRIRAPTSLRQMMWGGWTCQRCGAELNNHRQLIGGRIDSPDGIRVALRPPDQRRSRILVILGGCLAPALGGIGLVAGAMFGEWLLFVTFGVMIVLLLLGLVGLLGVLKRQEVLLTAATIQWGDSSIRPDTITDVRQEGDAVIIHTDIGQVHRLAPVGSPVALLGAIDEVRTLGRETGTVADVPSTLHQIRTPTLT